MSQETSSSQSSVTLAPATQVRDYLISLLQAASLDIDASSIRAKLDVSGSAPATPEMVIVTASDKGGHNGLATRVLIDIEATVSILTHLDEDETGSANDALEAQIMPALAAIPRGTALNGWTIRFEGNWQSQDPAIVNDSFRARDITATLFLQQQQ